MSIEHARERRSEKAEMLDRLETGRITIRQLLAAPPDALETCDVWDVLLRVPGLGREGVRTVCERAQVWPHTWWGKLMRSERNALWRELPDRVR